MRVCAEQEHGTHLLEAVRRRDELVPEGLLLQLHAGREAVGVGLVLEPVHDHPRPRVRVGDGRHVHRQPEPVQQLRPKLALRHSRTAVSITAADKSDLGTLHNCFHE